MRSVLSLVLLLSSTTVLAQGDRVKASVFDGIICSGHVDQGGYLNFAGPNINLVWGRHKFILGMMPSLRIK